MARNARTNETESTKTPPLPDGNANDSRAADEAETENVVPLVAPTATADVFANLDALRLKQDFSRRTSRSHSTIARCASLGPMNGSKLTPSFGSKPSCLRSKRT
jgi:hypothetical protein